MKFFVQPVVYALVLLMCLSFPCLASDQETITASVPVDVLQDYNLFLGDRDPLSIDYYGGPHSRRDVMELVLLQQALSLGKADQAVEFVPCQSYPRILEEVRLGRMDLSATSVWLRDLDSLGGSVSASRVLVPEGRFEAGLYTSEPNKAALAVDSVASLRKLIVVSSRNWTPDWKALTAMDLPGLLDLPKWDAMVRTVSSGRADVLLAPFQPTPGMVLHTQWGSLVPIPGVKIGLAGSRHFIVFIGSERGRRISSALDAGLARLMEQGTVERAYRECGFYNVATASWKMLNGE